MEQILFISAEVISNHEQDVRHVELKGEVNSEEFSITVQLSYEGKYSILTDEIESGNSDAIKIAYKHFSQSDTRASDMEHLSTGELLNQIPLFSSQVIAAASSANAVNW